MSFYSAAVTADSPTSYWRLDETSGTNAADQQSANAGTYTGVTLNQAGLIAADTDAAIVNNGGTGATVSHVSMGNVLGFTATSAFSLEAWMTPTDISTATRRLFCKRATDGGGIQGYEVSISTTGQLIVTRYLNGASDSLASAASVIAASNTYHVVATYDGTSLRLYVNGVLRAGPLTSSKSLIANTGVFRVGGLSSGGNYFTGTIDEVAVYSAALTAAQVLAHYNAGLGNLSGASASSSTASGALTAPSLLSGSSASTSTAAGTLTTTAPLSGTAGSTSASSGTVTTTASLTGSPASMSTATGAATTTAPMSGSAAATSTTAGTLTTTVPLSGSGSARSTAAGRLIYRPPPGRVILVRERPPVRLETGIQTPTGGMFRWALDEHKPENVPSGLSFSTTMPGGFEQANLTLPRKPGIDYPDLAEFSDVTIRGVGGRVAWHGRIDATPRTSGTQRSVSPSMVGWQAHLDANENVQMIYVSQQASLWADAPLDEQIRLAAGGTSYGDMSWSSQNGGLVCALPNQPVGASSAAEIWFIAPAGVLIAKIMYVGADFNPPAGWETPFLYSHSELLEAPSTAANAMTLDGALHTTTSTGPNRAISLRVFSNGTAATPVPGAQRIVTRIGVYGNHGLTTRATGATTPDGVLASDVVAHALQTWAPLLNFTTGADGTIQPSSFVIPHLIFTSLPTKVSDVIAAAIRYELPDWAVWENRTFWMHDRGARGRHWQARVGPSGLQETGPQSSRIWNSAVVQYANVDGTQRTVGPPGSGCDVTDASLVDLDPLNPANEAGETRRAVTAAGTENPASAIQIGGRFLQYQKLLDTSGQASIVGHVQDQSGVWCPAWMMRAGDTVSFVDAHSTSARRISKTSYDDGSKTCQISLDSPPEGMQELLDRMSISLIDTGLS